MATEVGVGYISIVPEVKGFASAMQRETSTSVAALGGLGTKADETGKKVGAAHSAMATAAKVAGGVMLAAGVGTYLKNSIAQAEDAATSQAKLKGVMTSMGYPQFTAQVQAHATALGRKIAVDNDDIAKTQAKIATFKVLGKTAGETGGYFDRVTDAAYDMQALGFAPAEQGAIMLSKAIASPEQAAALTRTGALTKAEAEHAVALAKSGHAEEARGYIMAAVEKQMQGAAEKNVTSQMKLDTALGEISEAIGTALLPVVTVLADALSGLANWMGENEGLVSTLTPVVVALGAAFAVAAVANAIANSALVGWIAKIVPAIAHGAVFIAQNLASAFVSAASGISSAAASLSVWIGRLIGAIAQGAIWLAQQIATAAAWVAHTAAIVAYNVALGILKAATVAYTVVQWLLNAALYANPIGLIVIAVAALVAAFIWLFNNVSWFHDAVITIWEGITAFWSTMWQFWQNVVQTAWNTIVTVVQTAWGIITGVVTTQINIVKSIIETVWNAIKSVTTTVWDSIKNVIQTAVNTVKNVIQTALNIVQNIWNNTFGKMRDIIVTVADKIKSVVNTMASVIQTAIDKVKAAIASVVQALASVPVLGSVISVLGMAGGGLVPGFGSGDTVPLMGTPGEFMATTQMVDQVGVGAMESWRQGGPPPGGGGGITVQNLNVNNPVAEPTSESLPRAMRSLAYVGVG